MSWPNANAAHHRESLATDQVHHSAPDRGSEVAPLLLDTFVEHARLDGRLAVQLTVVESNEPARRLYRSHGFVETGETEPHPKGGAVEIVMVRRLDGP